MLTCREISKWVSESLDRKLPLHLRVEVRLHLMMCRMCRRYRRQTVALRTILRVQDPSMAPTAFSDIHLSKGASERIKKALTTANE